ncbi:MAG TPA: tRNA threonylcarbamoyladenosine dehydratase [Candidatus Omnitrophota bacterium]|jgi:tRNA A37 threonylcarbamoyladenosine dehydratase|nr:MAG: tRNA threonylcarbamoyladenosine dehydratase [Candidatus Omnitrophica bacterium ADurb.Bin314]HOE69165.1 tRNA threonylcarbamoyladenosine dehydratase [Candidatus Omnitrophota bacterium]HQB93905.1 tRNA threonylcarbamoyladenosine dehydratase [Candidatus Omnitrophota bacterium]
MERLFCTELLIGKEKVAKLRHAFVTVVGIGAVGGFATEALARIGVGRLRLVDHDKVTTTNLNRNILALDHTLGVPKVEAMKQRIHGINPACKVEAMQMFAAEDSLEKVFSQRPDLVVDAIDALNPKVQVLTYCHANKIPVFSSMGAATRTKIHLVKSGDLSKSQGCPLAREVRGRLRRNGIKKGIFCVYSDEPVRKMPKVVNSEEDDYERGRRRAKLGSLPTIPAIFGLTLAHHAAEHLCGGF